MLHLLFVFSFLAAPTPPATSTTPAPKATSTATQLPAGYAEGAILRGQSISKSPAISLDEIFKNPKNYAGKTVVVNAQVSGVCKVKGCWMTISGKHAQTKARVTFKDYAFFVPKNCVGMKAKLEGQVQVKEMSEAERKHLAEDGNVSVDQIPKVELRIIAQGVELAR